ncbi:MAG: hypothetical protein M1825_003480 [Sarcosagium campestre]|nr:MAG: hypothetical protein M1825_003480 [Sarcosagium campestre]
MTSSLPKTFKGAVFEKAGAPLVLKDVPLEPPGKGQVLVKVLALGICRSDEDVQLGHFHNPFPIIPGHEIIGDVVAVGPEIEAWKIGDRVGGGWHGGHDGTCKQCSRGRHVMCQNEAINGVTRNGGFAEYVLLRTEAVVPVPTDADPAATAPFLCAGITVFNAMRNSDTLPGSVVAIQGLGGLGHLALQFAAKMGFRVVALSSSASKEQFAKDLGAHHYVDGSKESAVDALNKLGGAALILATAPNPKIMGELVNGLEPGGKLLIISPAGEITINTVPMIMKSLSIAGWPSGSAQDCKETIEFAQLHNVKCLIEKFKFKDAQKALEHMQSGKARFRAVVEMA